MREITTDSRLLLAGLMHDARGSRSIQAFFGSVLKDFKRSNERITFDMFKGWFSGQCYPRPPQLQLIAHSIGGDIGDEIMRLKPPPHGAPPAPATPIEEDEKMGKVVNMADHQKGAAAPQATAMTKEEGRLVFRAIEARWDDHEGRTAYKIGWSDAKVAEQEGVPVDWVRTIRERDFGGTGNDPGVETFIAEQIALDRDIVALDKLLAGFEATVSDYTLMHDKVVKQMGVYRVEHTRLATRVKALGELANTFQPARKAG